ncbi:MAG TPA: OB-fold domain-containing protein, partial [Mycobacterium sp.]|nr:OB-fold domain-containing protein [Mycobacterium sp.]
MTGRPLPLITIDNEFFWTSGADGKLRLQECGDCTALIHPPAPVCRYCRSHNLKVRAVSGRATLAGFTVNHRFSVPGLPAPYVVAQVAIAEDPRVRLTTNIIDCDPEQLELGQQVEVVFEHDEDVWLPLFRLVDDAEPAALPIDEIEPERFGEFVRPMLTPEKFEDKVALTGIGMSEIGRRLMVSPLSLTVAACEAAITDAGLTIDDIDGLSTYPGGGNLGGFGEGGVTSLEAALGIRPTWHNGGIETFGPGGSVIAAMLAIAGGLARHVLCFRTLWEATFNEQMKQGKIVPSGGRRADWLLPFGATSAAHTLAQNA